MKKNKGLIIGLAVAGAAIAGTIIFLTTTETGKKSMKKWGVKGKKIAQQAGDFIKEAGKKFENLKEEFAAKNEAALTDVYEQMNEGLTVSIMK